jgi:hypothetical protein
MGQCLGKTLSWPEGEEQSHAAQLPVVAAEEHASPHMQSGLPSLSLLDLPHPVPNIIFQNLDNPAKKALRLTCSQLKAAVEQCVGSFTVEAGNIHHLTEVQPLCERFPCICNLSVNFKLPDPQPRQNSGKPEAGQHINAPMQQNQAPCNLRSVPAECPSGHCCHGGMASYEELRGAAAATSLGAFLLVNLSQLKCIKFLDLCEAPVTPETWAIILQGLKGLRSSSIAIRIHPDAALTFRGRSWVDKLAYMLQELHAACPQAEVQVADSGLSWCDIEAEKGLRQV